MKKDETTLMVLPIDEEKVLKYIYETFPFAFIASNERYDISVGALVGSNVIVDTECCYQILEQKFHEGKVQFVYDIPVRVVTKTDEGESFPMATSFYFPMSIEKMESFMEKEQDLKTFMGQRYNYNPRIETNMRNFLRDVGSQIEKAEA